MNSKNKFEEQSEFFDKEVDYFSNLQAKRDVHQEIIINYFLDKLKKETSGKKILEIGGGTGMYTIPTLKAGYNITAVDLSKASLEACMKFAVEAGVSDLLTLVESPFELAKIDGNYDAVVGRHILHHLDDLSAVAKKAFSSLREDGVCIFIEPNPYCMLWYVYITLDRTRRWAIEKNIPQITPRRLKKIFMSNGFKSVSTSYYGFIPSGFVRTFPSLGKVNTLFSNTPLLKNVLALQIMVAKK